MSSQNPSPSEQQTQQQVLSPEEYLSLVLDTTAKMQAILSIEMQQMMQPEKQPNIDPLDPAHFAITSFVVGKLNMLANIGMQRLHEPQVDTMTQDTTLVDAHGRPLSQQPELIIDGEFREVGRGQ